MNAHDRGFVPANNQRIFRQMVEQDIERLIALLDNLAGDCDLEDDGGTEPSLGWPLQGPHAMRSSCALDRELDDVDLEDSGDAEPDDAATLGETA